MDTTSRKRSAVLRSALASTGVTLLAFASLAHAQPRPAAAAQVSKAAAPMAGYKKGFFLRSAAGDFKLKIGGRVQARYTATIHDGKANEGAFSIPRARLALSGNAFSEALTYKFQTDFSKGGAALKDFFFDYAFKKKVFQLRVGQFKRPFSRQQIGSSTHFDLIERAITDKAFGAGRDIGAAIHNTVSAPGIEYAFGVFNGTGEKGVFRGTAKVDTATGEGPVTGKVSNVPPRFHPEFVARVAFNHGGIKAYREPDFDKGAFRFAVGASGILDLDWDQDKQSAIRGELDYIVKLHGFSTSGAVYLSSKQNGASFGDQARDAVGFHLQASYVFGERFQPAARFAMVLPKGSDNDQQELLGGFAVFFSGHRFKWQTDAGLLRTQTAGGKTLSNAIIRTQGQVAF